MKKILFLSLILLAGIFAKAKVPATKLRLISAKSQQFRGGAVGSPSGTNYTFVVVAYAANEALVIDRLWIGNEYFEVKVYNQKNGTSIFSKKDTLEVVAKKYNPNEFLLNNQKTPSSPTQIATPCKYKGAALIGYQVGKKRKYLGVEKIESQAALNRP